MVAATPLSTMLASTLVMWLLTCDDGTCECASNIRHSPRGERHNSLGLTVEATVPVRRSRSVTENAGPLPRRPVGGLDSCDRRGKEEAWEGLCGATILAAARFFLGLGSLAECCATEVHLPLGASRESCGSQAGDAGAGREGAPLLACGTRRGPSGQLLDELLIRVWAKLMRVGWPVAVLVMFSLHFLQSS